MTPEIIASYTTPHLSEEVSNEDVTLGVVEPIQFEFVDPTHDIECSLLHMDAWR